VTPGWRNDGGKTCDEGVRAQHNGVGAIGPRAFEVELDFVVGQGVQAVVGKGRAQDVAAQMFTPLLVVAVYAGGGVQIESPLLGAEALTLPGLPTQNARAACTRRAAPDIRCSPS